jgi:hypothetical protein
VLRQIVDATSYRLAVTGRTSEEDALFTATVLNVLIATPGDTAEELDAITQSLIEWNRRRAESAGVVLIPRHWKADGVPVFHADGAQGAINAQIVDRADIVIAVFDSRLGQETLGAVSGTAHEIERTSAAGKPVHVYFSDEPVSRAAAANTSELKRLADFRKELESKGLLGVYPDPRTLGRDVCVAIEHDLEQLGIGGGPPVPSAPREHAMPRLSRVGKEIVVENRSPSVTAEGLALQVLGDRSYFRFFYDGEPLNLLPLADYSWPISVAAGAQNMRVKMQWVEDGEPQELEQTVRL